MYTDAPAVFTYRNETMYRIITLYCVVPDFLFYLFIIKTIIFFSFITLLFDTHFIIAYFYYYFTLRYR